MSYDQAYLTVSEVFGADPEQVLLRFLPTLPPGGPVLDLGVGQGRNALPLARCGLTVHGIDPSSAAIETVQAAAHREGLPMMLQATGFEAFIPPVPAYAAILVFGLVQILTWDQIACLVERLDRWTETGSLILLTAFTTEDDTFRVCREQGTLLGRNSYRTRSGGIRTFLQPGEATGLLPGFAPVHHWEGLGPWHRHGNGPKERHALVETVFRK